MRPTFIWNTPSHHRLHFFPLCLSAPTPGSPSTPAPFQGFLPLKNLEWLPGAAGMQPAQHRSCPEGRSLYPILPPPTRVICFCLRAETGSISSEPCGYCVRCGIYTAFLVGLGEPPSRISLNRCETPTRSRRCKPSVFPLPRKLGRRGIQSLAARLPSLDDPASWDGSALGAALPTAACTCPRARAQRPVPCAPRAHRPFPGTESRPLPPASGAPAAAPAAPPGAHASPYPASPAGAAAATAAGRGGR